MGNSGPYKPCHTSKKDAPYLYGIDGPSDGIGYYAWYLHPENTFANMEDATKVARLMNIAYAAGLRDRSRQIRELLE